MLLMTTSFNFTGSLKMKIEKCKDDENMMTHKGGVFLGKDSRYYMLILFLSNEDGKRITLSREGKMNLCSEYATYSTCNEGNIITYRIVDDED